MSSIYLLDTDLPQDRREWQEMLPHFGEVSLEFDDLKPAPHAGDVVIVHASSVHPSDLETLAGRYRHVGLIVVSGSRQGASSGHTNLYHRRCSVGKKDMVFAKCFDRFWQHLQEKKERVFSLLEPEGSPESLLAIFLAARAMARYRNEDDAEKRKRIAGAMPKEVLDSAKAEFDKKGGQGWNGGLPDGIIEIEAMEKCLAGLIGYQ
jgi:hypothetical protein